MGFVGVLLLVVLVWVLRDPRKLNKPDDDLASNEEWGQRHVAYFPQVRQAIDRKDFEFLALRGLPKLTKRVRKERRRIALAYLACIRADFLKLWRLARVIAAMSPQVGAAEEFARLGVFNDGPQAVLRSADHTPADAVASLRETGERPF